MFANLEKRLETEILKTDRSGYWSMNEKKQPQQPMLATAAAAGQTTAPPAQQQQQQQQQQQMTTGSEVPVKPLFLQMQVLKPGDIFGLHELKFEKFESDADQSDISLVS